MSNFARLSHLNCLPWCALVLLSLVGCAKSQGDANRPKVVPASGTVTYQGKTVEGAEVTFNNSKAKLTGTAKTGADGKFKLSTFDIGDGVAPGRHAVGIRRVDVIDKTPPGVDVSAGGQAIPPEIRWLIPQKYADPATSGLTAEVSESGPNEFRFDLK